MSGKKNPAQDKVEILVVEDSSTQAEALRYILEQKGYRATLARNGRQALNQLNGYRPVLIISDIIMPEMDGYELCRRIKTDEHTRDIQVILLTSLIETGDVMQGLECGADSFISKPYEANYLLGQVEQALANLSSQANEHSTIELEIPLGGKSHLIRANPQRIVSLTVSIYEAAIHRNAELLQSQYELKSMNEHLEELVEGRTAALSAEIAERERLQAELRELSLRDELTGLHNRRGFMTLAEQHRRLALRTRQEFVLLYLDMDGLKYINDTFGHAQGDQALQAVALSLEKTFRESDILARHGGDEFIILLTEVNLTSANPMIARLMENLRQANSAMANRYTLSLSIGLAQFNPNNQATISELVEQADAAMYAQKNDKSERGKR
jgi:two-component system, cell cycle response regulator